MNINYDEIDKLDSIKERIIRNFNIRNITAKKAIQKRFSEEGFQKFSLLVRTLLSMYGYDVDIQIGNLEVKYKYINNNYGDNHNLSFRIFDKIHISFFNIIIKYPSVDIRNSNNETFNIKDLFVVIKVKIESNDIKFYDKIGGFRMSLSKIEYVSRFNHPHLHSNILNNSNDYMLFKEYMRTCNNSSSIFDFCTGTGQDIDKLLNSISEEEFYTEENIIQFFLLVDMMVGWESIEGVPYKRLATIGYLLENSYSNTELIESNDIDNEKLELIFKILINNILSDNNLQTQFINLSLSIDIPNIVFTKTGIEFLVLSLKDKLLNIIPNMFTVYYGSFYYPVNIENRLKNIKYDNVKFIFNNKSISLSLYDIDLPNFIRNYRVNNIILKFILDKLNDYAKKESIREVVLR